MTAQQLHACYRKAAIFAMSAFIVSTNASAQETYIETLADDDQREIVVTATRLRGSVITDIPPVAQIDAKDIASYGASSVTDLVAAIAPQTGSGRGRGGGAPVILLNGQRISGFRELRDLPPEAIQQVQVFPEEVALQYGYRPDQRVINFILKDNFASVSTEIEGGLPEDGGYATQQYETNLTNIDQSTRFNLKAEYQHSSRLTETERGVIPAGGALSGSGNENIGDFRTVLPLRDVFEVNGNWSKMFAPQTSVSLNANYSLNTSESLLGLPTANLLLPGTSPFSLSGSDAIISRSFQNPGPLTRDTEISSAKFGFSFNSRLAEFRWSATGNYERTKNQTSTLRNADFSALRAGLIAGTVNPFDPAFGNDLIFAPADTSNSTAQIVDLANILTGEVFRLPAGAVRITIRTGFSRETLNSAALRSGITNDADLRRNNLNSSLNIEIPFVERGVDTLGFLGEIGINGNFGVSSLSDFGRLTEYTAGIRWAPVKELSFQATLIGDENAPAIGQLGNPLLTTPNVSYFDFNRNETALIDVISGGNTTLVAEKRRDLKLSVNWAPAKIRDLNFQVEYFRNRSSNTTANFPILTPEIEAAFSSRISRDAAGRLVRVDQRPVNFDEERSQKIRTGFNISGGIGQQQRGAGFGGGQGRDVQDRGAQNSGGRIRKAAGDAAATGIPSTAAQTLAPSRLGGQGRGPEVPETGGRSADRGPSGGTDTRGFGRGGFSGGPGGGTPGRWQISLYHSFQIQDEVLIRADVPRLDLLNGSATSNLGGTPRHQFELSGGIFYKGLGLRANGNYRSSTRADGNGLPGSSDLRFSDLTTLNFRFFVNLDDRGDLTNKFPFLKGSRIAFNIDNALNDFVSVRDQNGIIPLSYQPAYLDPKGRYFELSFRKRF
jgi:iron complex outermembrane recepter protein